MSIKNFGYFTGFDKEDVRHFTDDQDRDFYDLQLEAMKDEDHEFHQYAYFALVTGVPGKVVSVSVDIGRLTPDGLTLIGFNDEDAYQDMIKRLEASGDFSYQYDGENLIPPPDAKATDTPLTRFQFNAMSRLLGLSIEQIKTQMETVITDPVQQAIAIARIEETQEFHRDNPLFAALAPVLGMTDEQIDAAWEQALAIEL